MRKKGEWETALEALAGWLKCYVCWNSSERSSEMFDPAAAGGSCVGRMRDKTYQVCLAVMVKDKTVLPSGKKLELWDKKKPLFKYAGVECENSSGFRGEASIYYRTREAACRNFLKSLSGKTVGMLDQTTPKNPYADYQLTRFVPFGRVPEFKSLQELELKLAASGG